MDWQSNICIFFSLNILFHESVSIRGSVDRFLSVQLLLRGLKTRWALQAKPELKELKFQNIPFSLSLQLFNLNYCFPDIVARTLYIVRTDISEQLWLSWWVANLCMTL